MNKHLAALLCALGVMLCLSGCGGNSEEQRQLHNQLDQLEQQVAALEEENTSLKDQLQAQPDSSEQTGGVQEEAGEENPIDSFYATVETDGSTVAMDAVADSQANAWQAEVEHLVQVLKEQLPLPEDQELIDAYRTAAQEQVERMNIMAIYPISDLTLSQQDRVMSSGTMRGLLWAGGRTRIWRDTFWQLYAVSPDTTYTFAFDPNATQQELDALLQVG